MSVFESLPDIQKGDIFFDNVRATVQKSDGTESVFYLNGGGEDLEDEEEDYDYEYENEVEYWGEV